MARQDFQDRIARIQSGGGGLGVALAGEGHMAGGGFGVPAGASDQGSKGRGPGFLARLLIGIVFIPLGFVLSFLTALFLDPDITPEAVNYVPLLVIVATGHVLLFAGVLAALAAKFRKKGLNTLLFTAFAGYGLASALLNYAIQ
jgi:hypothetical protein